MSITATIITTNSDVLITSEADHGPWSSFPVAAGRIHFLHLSLYR
jgi:hypothetical protein